MTLREAFASPHALMTHPRHLAGHRLACAALDGWTYTALLWPDGETIKINAVWAAPGEEWLRFTPRVEDLRPDLAWRPWHGLLRHAEEETRRQLDREDAEFASYPVEQQERIIYRLLEFVTDSPGDQRANLAADNGEN